MHIKALVLGALVMILLTALPVGAHAGNSVNLRKFPYPYSAMLAISSDCDDMNLQSFLDVQRFLNTFDETPWGTGLGLDIANSFFLYNGSDFAGAYGMMTWFDGINPAAELYADVIQKFWHAGLIDTLHTFGDFSHTSETLFSRRLAIAGKDAMRAAGVRPTVWVDHGTSTNVQNFGASELGEDSFAWYQEGDNPQSEFFHTDITLACDIRFVWHTQNSNVFGRNFPLWPRRLRDGQVVWNFARYTNEIRDGSIWWTWVPNRIRYQITAEKLDELERAGQYAIIAQHFNISWADFCEEDIDALRLLAQRFHTHRTILVARTSRLLAYAVAQKFLSYEYVMEDDAVAIFIRGINDPVTGFRPPFEEELRGLTFYVPNPERTTIYVNDKQLPASEIQVNPTSVSIRWFCHNPADYSALLAAFHSESTSPPIMP